MSHLGRPCGVLFCSRRSPYRRSATGVPREPAPGDSRARHLAAPRASSRIRQLRTNQIESSGRKPPPRPNRRGSGTGRSSPSSIKIGFERLVGDEGTKSDSDPAPLQCFIAWAKRRSSSIHLITLSSGTAGKGDGQPIESRVTRARTTRNPSGQPNQSPLSLCVNRSPKLSRRAQELGRQAISRQRLVRAYISYFRAGHTPH